jgi:hypothetical protein
MEKRVEVASWRREARGEAPGRRKSRCLWTPQAPRLRLPYRTRSDTTTTSVSQLLLLLSFLPALFYALMLPTPSYTLDPEGQCPPMTAAPAT